MKNNKITLQQLFSIKWYIEQTKGWMRESYALILIAIIGNAYISFGMGHPVTWTTFVTYLASILSIWTIGGITNAKPVNGVGGLTSAILYIIVALVAKNPADAMLQFIYIVLLDAPVLLLPSWSANVDKKIRFIHETGLRKEKHGPAFWYGVISATVVVVFILSYLMEVYILDSPRPLVDSAVLGSGFAGAILTTFRFGESAMVWFIQGALQVILWGQTAMMGDANWVLFFTYMLFMLNDILLVTKSKWMHHKSETEEIVESLN